MPKTPESLDDFRTRALAWLEVNAKRKLPDAAMEWGVGSDSVALFQNLTYEGEREHIDAVREWIRKKDDAGLVNLTWPREWGGQELPQAYARAFSELEAQFVTPPGHEAIGITVSLIAPTILAVGTEQQRRRFLRPMLRTDELWCQLFSEPGAGSDLASVSTRAVREGDGWVLSGQKVWTSGAQFAQWGYALCRTDLSVPKHRGLTAFLVPMDAPGVEVRPLRQATGGTSFNEVFFTDVRVPDGQRLGDVGEGWRVALTTLGFERGSASLADAGVAVRRLMTTARHLGCDTDPLVRQHLARAYSRQRVGDLTIERANARRRTGEAPGPEGSLGKLSWTECLQVINTTAAAILGPRLVADTGEWGTYAWSEHLMGAAGYRIAAGSDEVQRNIIAERVLGLPAEPRADRDIPFREGRRSSGRRSPVPRADQEPGSCATDRAEAAQEALVRERVEKLLIAHDPRRTSARVFLGAQFDAGLAWVHFPEGAGGLGLSSKTQHVVDERLSAAGAPTPSYEQMIGIGMGAPTLATYAADEFRRQHLRAIFTGEEIWCQLFSEPSAGSDVANLSTTAVREGERWIVRGQKVWTTFAHIADWGMLLARTDANAPKHAGLTYFVIQMRQPGIDVRPIRQIDGSAEFNEVFFDDASVPDSHRLGAVGDGWRVAITTLMNERVAIGGSAEAESGPSAIDMALEAWRAGPRDPVSRDELVGLWSRSVVNRLTVRRAEAARRTGNPGPEGSIGKLAVAELMQDITCFSTNQLGPRGMLYPSGEEFLGNTARADPRAAMLYARSLTIAGGTSEIMRNILAERVLRLPDAADARVGKDISWRETSAR